MSLLSRKEFFILKFVFYPFLLLLHRAELRLETNNSLAQLEIDPLMTADEDLYKCEVTYLEAKDHCALPQSIRLNTFGKFLQLPTNESLASSKSSSVKSKVARS